MSDYFLGEIRMFSFSWAPDSWALCQGQSLPVNQNQALYALLGITFGGTPSTSFNLPDLRGRAPLCTGRSPISGTLYQQGVAYQGGGEGVTLTAAQVPVHSHTVMALSTQGTTILPTDGIVSSVKTATANPLLYGTVSGTPTTQALNPATVSAVGGQAHSNLQPFTVANFCIATRGLFPARN